MNQIYWKKLHTFAMAATMGTSQDTAHSMMYISTRSNGTQKYSFQDALLMGYPPDGGLFVPCTIPKIDKATLLAWAKLSYPALATAVAQLFIPAHEIPLADQADLIQGAFENFRIPQVVRTKELSDKCLVLELFHGPTYAFKDLAMACTGRFLAYFLQKNHKHLNIIVSTSGDTGTAAIEALRDRPLIDLYVMYPLGRVTELQELQMTTAVAKNIHLFGISGTSDDGDEVMNALFADQEFTTVNNLSNVNSINWLRILIQIVHHFFAYFQALPNCDGTVEIVCPTGAGGNLAAACLAYAMGLPIKIVACVNENDFVHKMIQKGVLSSGDVVPTLASAMDIQIPYNVERILYILSDGDGSLVKELLTSNAEKKKGHVALPPRLVAKIKQLFKSHKTSDHAICGAMKTCWDQEGYLVCPHTATALAYHYRHPTDVAFDSHDDSPRRRVCISTASAIKFPEACKQAGVPPHPESVKLVAALKHAPHRVTKLTNKAEWVHTLRNTIEKTTNSIEASKVML